MRGDSRRVQRPPPSGPRCNLYISSAHKGEARRSQQALTELTCPSHDCEEGSPLLDGADKREGILDACNFQSHSGCKT